MAIEQAEKKELQESFFKMQSTFEYVLNRNDYNALTPALSVFIMRIKNAGGGPNDVRYFLRDLGTLYQRKKIIPLAVEELRRLIKLDKVTGVTSTTAAAKAAAPVKEEEPIYHVDTFLRFSDEWAYELERFNYCILPDDMNAKLTSFFKQGNTADTFNNAIRFGGIDDEEFVMEMVDDLYSIHAPAEPKKPTLDTTA